MSNPLSKRAAFHAGVALATMIGAASPVIAAQDIPTATVPLTVALPGGGEVLLRPTSCFFESPAASDGTGQQVAAYTGDNLTHEFHKNDALIFTIRRGVVGLEDHVVLVRANGKVLGAVGMPGMDMVPETVADPDGKRRLAQIYLKECHQLRAHYRLPDSPG